MRILLTGATGQVGRAFLETSSGEHTIIPTVHQTPLGEDEAIPLDLTTPASIRRAVAGSAPDWIVNAAAVSDVDACEADTARAETVNADAVGELARAADEYGARLLNVSTDYVFDGEAGPYAEDDEPDPINAYGRTKLAGEHAAREVLGDEALIARTCVVYGPHRPNFVTWCRQELEAGNEISVVEDQVVTPTYSLDLAEQLLALIEADASGTVHTAGATRLSRLTMAQVVAEVFELDTALVTACRREDLDWEAPRPRDTSLSTDRMRGIHPPMTFNESIRDLRARLEERPVEARGG
jgi:dTDP-4-dehydrorhamnose reductase